MIENIDAKIDEVKNLIAEQKEIRAKKEFDEKQREVRNLENVSENKSVFADLAKGMKENRTVTLSGTGTVNTVRELVKLISAKKEILSKVRYFFGANKNTVVPVWGTAATRPAPVAEGGAITASAGNLGNKTLIPYAFATSFNVSNETLDLSAVDFEAELQVILADAFADAMAYQIFSGAGTSGAFSGLGVMTASNEVETASSTAVSLADLAGFALEMADKVDGGCIFMNPAVYAKFIADSADAHKVYREDLIRNKTIEGVPVYLTSYAPATGDNLAYGADFGNYAVAVAGDMKVTPKENPGNLYKTFDAYMYLAGSPVLEGNFYTLKQAA